MLFSSGRTICHRWAATVASHPHYSRRLLSSRGSNLRQSFSPATRQSRPNRQQGRRGGGGGDGRGGDGVGVGDGMPYAVMLLGLGIPVVGLTTYVYVAYLDTVPLTKRRRWIATSPEWERQRGDQEYQQLLEQFRGQILPHDHRAARTVRRVGHRIYHATQTFCAEQEDVVHHAAACVGTGSSPPTFTVVRSEEANAFVLPNNHIFVLTGLFHYARDEDELASVLGHEMAHNVARHMGEKISGNLVVQLLAQLSLLVDPSGTFLMFFLPTANLLRELPHSRTQELEADQIGMHLAALACYDPAAAPRVFGRMRDTTGEGPPQFLSTHPSHSNRIQLMGEWLPDARSILEREGGETCRSLRQDMDQARRVAAQRATAAEWKVRGGGRPSQ